MSSNIPDVRVMHRDASNLINFLSDFQQKKECNVKSIGVGSETFF